MVELAFRSWKGNNANVLNRPLGHLHSDDSEGIGLSLGLNPTKPQKATRE